MKRKIAVAALSIASALALTACGTPSDGGTTGSSTGEGAEIRVWLVGTDTPQASRDYLKETFEAENPGSTLVIEEQSWTNLVDKLTTSLSGSDSPDIVEVGNTQAAAFTSAGAFMDLSDYYEDLGGDDLLPGFVDAGSFGGKFYAAPYYSGPRVITYSSDIVSLPIPTTWDEYLANAKSMTTDTLSGLYMPGKDWHDSMTFVWANGGEIATQNADGTWEAGFSSPESIKGLEQFQDMFATANHMPVDGQEGNQQIPFCAGQLGYLPAPTWVTSFLTAAPDAETPGCGDGIGHPDKLVTFAIPGQTAGTYAPVLAGGSNIAISNKSNNKELAVAALKIIMTDEYMKGLAGIGFAPAKISQAQYMPDNQATEAVGQASSFAKITPASPMWANVEGSQVLEDSFSKIAGGADVATVAAELDAEINRILNEA